MIYMNNNILIFLLKTTLSFINLLLLTRLLGKKEMSKLTFFDYITGITIGSITAHIITSPDMSRISFLHNIAALIWWCFLTGLAGFISLKSRKIRTILNGEPSIVIKKGKIIKKVLASSRLNMDDLKTMLREQSIFSLQDVDYAILESNGHLSVLKKQTKLPPTKQDMQIPTTTPEYLPTALIINGKVIEHNLKELDLNQNWLENQLKALGVNSIEDIFYGEIQGDGSLYLSEERK